jgi:hypothetical protein
MRLFVLFMVKFRKKKQQLGLDRNRGKENIFVCIKRGWRPRRKIHWEARTQGIFFSVSMFPRRARIINKISSLSDFSVANLSNTPRKSSQLMSLLHAHGAATRASVRQMWIRLPPSAGLIRLQLRIPLELGRMDESYFVRCTHAKIHRYDFWWWNIRIPWNCLEFHKKHQELDHQKFI